MAEELEEPEEECPEFTYKVQGLAACEFLRARGAATAYDFYKCYHRLKPRFKPQDAYRLFWLLKKLGLIDEVGKQETPHRSERFWQHLYMIRHDCNESEYYMKLWANPPRAYYGDERYR